MLDYKIYQNEVKKIGIKQIVLAERMGISPQYLSQFLTGCRNMREDRIFDLRKILKSLGSNI